MLCSKLLLGCGITRLNTEGKCLRSGVSGTDSCFMWQIILFSSIVFVDSSFCYFCNPKNWRLIVGDLNQKNIIKSFSPPTATILLELMVIFMLWL